MLELTGESSGQYFLIRCKVCNEDTSNEYLGRDNAAPQFRANCEQCGKQTTYKLRAEKWKGLPAPPHNPG